MKNTIKINPEKFKALLETTTGKSLSASNHADIDFVVGGKALCAAAENQRSRACGKHSSQKAAPVYRIVHNHFSL